jgi:hypothetical protein
MSLSFQSVAAVATYSSIPASAVGVWKGFLWFDGGLNDRGKTQLSRWLQNQNSEDDPHAFAGLIERVFGKRAFSGLFFFIHVWLLSSLYPCWRFYTAC